MLKLVPRNAPPGGREGATSGGGGRNRLPNANLSISVPRKGTPVANKRERPAAKQEQPVIENKVNEVKLFRKDQKNKSSSREIGTVGQLSKNIH